MGRPGLELKQSSQLGTPGLLGALREGSLTLVNALGTGILETRALLAFLPRISQALTGKPLAMPNIATWWCGQEAERAHVKANLDTMNVGSAYATSLLFDQDDVSTLDGGLDQQARQPLADWVEHGAGQLVGQEAVKLSTAPALENGRLSPRPMSLRVFMARTADGWKAMPGGFARIGHSGTSADLSMQRGGSVADVWVIGSKPVRHSTVPGYPAQPYVRQEPAMLPSRAADNFFWLGRYVERFEFNVRLLRAYHLRHDEAPVGGTALLRVLEEYLQARRVRGERGVDTIAGGHACIRGLFGGPGAGPVLARWLDGAGRP